MEIEGQGNYSGTCEATWAVIDPNQQPDDNGIIKIGDGSIEISTKATDDKAPELGINMSGSEIISGVVDADELAKIASGDENLQIVFQIGSVEPDEAEIKRIQTVVPGATIVKTMDIKLLCTRNINGETKTEIVKKPYSKQKITLKMSSDILNKRDEIFNKIFMVHDYESEGVNSTQVIDVEIKGDTLYFGVDHYSHFSIVYKDTEKPKEEKKDDGSGTKNTPENENKKPDYKTGDSLTMLYILLMISVIGESITLTVICRKKKSHDRNNA